jgi:hypothetical protein
MVAASLVHENAQDLMRLAFASHDVEITGQNLRELLIGLQDFSVKWLRASPNRYHGIAVAESAIITDVRVSAAE